VCQAICAKLWTGNFHIGPFDHKSAKPVRIESQIQKDATLGFEPRTFYFQPHQRKLLGFQLPRRKMFKSLRHQGPDSPSPVPLSASIDGAVSHSGTLF
jgi:hypothetical protein